MRKAKKIILTIMAATMMFSLAACGSSSSSADGSDEVSEYKERISNYEDLNEDMMSTGSKYYEKYVEYRAAIEKKTEEVNAQLDEEIANIKTEEELEEYSRQKREELDAMVEECFSAMLEMMSEADTTDEESLNALDAFHMLLREDMQDAYFTIENKIFEKRMELEQASMTEALPSETDTPLADTITE